MKKEVIWHERKEAGCYTDTVDGVFLSYNPNTMVRNMGGSDLDSANPETAIVLVGDKKNGQNRYLIYRGDRREELVVLFPDKEKLKEHWKAHGGHFWSDNLTNE